VFGCPVRGGRNAVTFNHGISQPNNHFCIFHTIISQLFWHIQHNYSTNISAHLALLIGSEKSARKLVVRAILGVWHWFWCSKLGTAFCDPPFKKATCIIAQSDCIFSGAIFAPFKKLGLPECRKVTMFLRTTHIPT